MIGPGTLWKAAKPGLQDLVVAPFRSVDRERGRAALLALWGEYPRFTLFVLAILSAIAGQVVPGYTTNVPFSGSIHWPVLLFAMVIAWRVRTVISEDGGPFTESEWQSPDEAFRAIALPVVGASVVMVAADVAIRLLLLGGGAGDGWIAGLSFGTHFVEQLLCYGAATAVLLAVLTFHKDWFGSLFSLLFMFIIFEIMVGIARMLLITLAPFSSIAAFLVDSFTKWAVPPEMQDLMDLVSHAGFMSLIYIGVIGAVWLMARDGFGELMAGEEVDVLGQLDQLGEEEETEAEAEKEEEA